MADRLTGKVAVITGSTSGIGEATARRFIAEGAAVVISGRNVTKGAALAAELGPRARFQAADVRREADIAALLDFAVQEFGRLDCVFNNAGGPTAGTPETVTEAHFNDAMQLLVGSVVFGIKHAALPPLPCAGLPAGQSPSGALRSIVMFFIEWPPQAGAPR